MVRPSPDSDDYVEIACVAVVSYPRTREAREGMEREKEQKLTSPLPMLQCFCFFSPEAFVRFSRSLGKETAATKGYVEMVESAMIP